MVNLSDTSLNKNTISVGVSSGNRFSIDDFNTVISSTNFNMISKSNGFKEFYHSMMRGIKFLLFSK